MSKHHDLLTEKMALERSLSEVKAEQSRDGMRRDAEHREVLHVAAAPVLCSVLLPQQLLAPLP
jgi:hypothetical protein